MSLTSTKSEYCLTIEAKNEGMTLEPRAYPTIKEYYEACSVGNERPITYQKGLSNYSNVQLGDERITFKKSLAKSTYTKEQIRAQTHSVLTDAHLRNDTKSPKVRHADYMGALDIVGEQSIIDLETLIRDRLIQCTHEDPQLLHKAFHHFDRDNSGGIDIREFNNALKSIGLDFEEIEVYALFGKYDADCQGVINFQLFQECVLTGKTPNRRFQTTGWSFGHSNENSKEYESDEETERLELNNLQEARIAEYFTEVDQRDRGYLDSRGINQLLDKLSKIIPTQSREIILKQLGNNSKDRITLQEFITAWRNC